MVNILHLALAFDERYITPFYVLLASLFANSGGNKIHIHLIVTGLAHKEKLSIINYIKSHGNEAIFYDISEQGVDKFITPDHEGSYLSTAAYYRLFFPLLLAKSITKFVYIDVDTLVVGDISMLLEIDLKGHAVAAVKDTDMPVRAELGIYNMDDYFNSGVLLIDVIRWNEQQITEQTLKIIKEQPELIKQYADQDALNMVLKGNWYRLPTCYNLMRLYVPHEMPKRRFNDFLKQQKIIHYNGKKPWFSDCEHRLRHVYQHYARLAPVPGADKITKVQLPKEKRKLLAHSRRVEFYFDHPELVTVWRKLKAFIGRESR